MKLAKWFGAAAVAVAVLGLAACGASNKEAGNGKDKTVTIKIGTMTIDNDEQQRWDLIQKKLEKENVKLEFTQFTEYPQVNKAVAKKTAKDGANSKVYAKFGVEIYVAAKKGDPDPETNTALKFVIDRAKQAQVPKHVIDKAIDKAKGNTDETFTEGRYEGFGPNGSMLIVDTLTSNVNRTAANVRAAFGKNGGNMGASGSVSYLFDNKGVVVFAGDDADSIFELLLEADVDVDDVEAEEGTITVYTAPTDLHKAIVALRESGIEEFQVTELEMIPQSEVELSGDDLAIFEKLVDVLEDDEDVQKVYTNVEGF